MANFRAIHAVGTSIATFLQNNYPPQLKADFPCTFRLVSSAELATDDAAAFDRVVSIFLHRITLNEQMRAVSRLQNQADVQPAVFLDLHYLLTYWGPSVEAEQTVLGWMMQELTRQTTLDSSILSSVAQWRPDESVQLVPTSLSLDDTLKIWEALAPKYRLSVPYIARVVHIDRAATDFGPVVAIRHALSEVNGS